MMVLLIFIIIMLVLVCLLLVWMIRQMQNNQEKPSTSQGQISMEAGLLAASLQNDLDRLEQGVQDVLRQNSASASLMQDLKSSMQDMNAVMNNTKKRGTWGEMQMETLIRLYAGDNPDVYDLQYHLENGRIADGVFHIPGSDKLLCIDSKFPMENYLAMQQDPESADYYLREFRKNMKKHIGDVASRYITPQTENLAILFIPSEAIYQYVCGQGEDLLHYALDHHVLLTSPTTLAGVIFTLLSSTRDFYRARSLQQIEKNLYLLEEDLQRLDERLAYAMKNAQASLAALEKSRVSASLAKGRVKNWLEGCMESASVNSQEPDSKSFAGHADQNSAQSGL